MQKPGLILLMLAAGLICGCASRDSRIHEGQTAFDSFPSGVQDRIRHGDIDIGFTPEMTRMALGEPDRKYTRTTANGVREIWAYQENRPTFGFGLGIGSFGGGFGGGLGVSTVGDAPDDRLRAIFQDNKLVSIERITQ